MPRAGADYLDLLNARYAARDGRHVHFGPLPKTMIDRIEALLVRIGRFHDFVQVPFIPYLSVALADLKPDLYIGSYPMGGKRASVEAMAAACPIAAWRNEGYHSAAEVTYPQHLGWRDPDDLASMLTDFTAEQKLWHSQCSRLYFEHHHSEEILRARLTPLLPRPA